MSANPLIKYLGSLTTQQRVEFARRADSSVTSIRLAANGYKTKGCLSLTPEFAARLEAASDGALRRTELSPTCCNCPLAKCANKKAK